VFKKNLNRKWGINMFAYPEINIDIKYFKALLTVSASVTAKY
jgi:hypothetical protein